VIFVPYRLLRGDLQIAAQRPTNASSGSAGTVSAEPTGECVLKAK
jgi:hypothetical protein